MGRAIKQASRHRIVPVIEQHWVPCRQPAQAGEARGAEEEDELAVLLLVVVAVVVVGVGVGGGGGGEGGQEGCEGLCLVDWAVEGGAWRGE